MRRRHGWKWISGGAMVAGGLAIWVLWFQTAEDPAGPVRIVRGERIEAAPLCPWREPEKDLASFFPGAQTWTTHVAVLSGQRMELGRWLGRTPSAEENALHIHTALMPGQPSPGCITTRRVKGEFGAIELVLATDPEGSVVGVRLQRLREPAPIVEALEGSGWLNSFREHRRTNAFALGRDLPTVPPIAELSARAIADGVRSQLVLLSVAQTSAVTSTRRHADSAHP